MQSLGVIVIYSSMISGGVEKVLPPLCVELYLLFVLYSLFKKFKKEEKTNRGILVAENTENHANIANNINTAPIHINIGAPLRERSPDRLDRQSNHRYSGLNRNLAGIKNETVNEK